jgi:hypothetical protein
MINLEIDFDAIRENVLDYIFAGAGHIAQFAEGVIDKAEEIFEQLPDAE